MLSALRRLEEKRRELATLKTQLAKELGGIHERGPNAKADGHKVMRFQLSNEKNRNFKTHFQRDQPQVKHKGQSSHTLNKVVTTPLLNPVTGSSGSTSHRRA